MTAQRKPARQQGVQRAGLALAPFAQRSWLALGVVLVVGAAVRILLLRQYLTDDPLSAYPLVDAKTYWDWAGRIANGALIGHEPFFSAPLYPYLLAILRAAGGGLSAVYAVQILLDLATAALVAWIARWHWGAWAGVVAAALFLLLLEPAAFSLRILSCTLQLPLVCLVWLTLRAAYRVPSCRRAALSGLALGLLALSYASAAIAIPIIALWRWMASRDRTGLRLALATVVAALLVLAPATLHNYLACGEFIPISAQAGITFAQGNAGQATGTYTQLPGIGLERDRQHRDAARVYQRATGRNPTWRAVSAYWFHEGLAAWRADPLGAAKLLAAKAYWFLTGRNYSDIYWPTLEAAHGLLTRLRLAPLPTPWLIPPALVVLAVWFRRPLAHLPELVLLGVPLLTVIVFFYSPRYRFPVTPVLAVACAGALHQAIRAPARRRWSLALVAAVAVGLGLGALNHRYGFDPPQEALFQDRLGAALFEQGQPAQALPHFARAVQLLPAHANLQANLAASLLRCGDSSGALQHFRRAVELDPTLLDAHKQLSQILCASGDIAGGIAALRRAYELAPEDADIANNLAWYLATMPDLPPADRATALRLAEQAAATSQHQDPGVLDTLAAALAAVGDFPQAAATLEEALALEARHGPTALTDELRSRLALYQSGRSYVAPPAPARP